MLIIVDTSERIFEDGMQVPFFGEILSKLIIGLDSHMYHESDFWKSLQSNKVVITGGEKEEGWEGKGRKIRKISGE